MKSAIIGFGSIGERHAEVLKELDHDVAIVTSREEIDYPAYNSIPDLLNNHKPEYIVVSNETSRHLETLQELEDCGYNGMVMVEKPIFASESQIKKFKFKICVGYNLRFHPGLQKLKVELDKVKKIASVNIYVGQNLKTWRKRPYTDSYSGKKELGGGVLRDLSHELDYLVWLLGKPTALVSNVKNSGIFDIETEDNASILIETKKCSNVVIHMNYLDRNFKREIVVNTEHKTINIDMIENNIIINKDVESVDVKRNVSYRDMHRNILRGNGDVCSFEEGCGIVKLIESIEESAREKKWINV